MADDLLSRIPVQKTQSTEIHPNNEILKRNLQGADFGSMLRQQLNTNNTPLQFSKHAQERISQRGIEISPTLLENLNEAVNRARDKGAKDLVIIDQRGAFIVNVPNNTVVTSISEQELKQNIFTNIDSAVIL